MAFEIQRARGSLPGRGSGVTFDANLDTGAGQVAAAVGEAGGAVAGLAVTLNRLQAENQLSEAKRQTQEVLNQLALDFDSDPDSSTYQQRFNDAMGKIQGFAPKNKLASKAFGNLVKSQRVSGSKFVQESMLERERDTKRADVALMMTKGQFKRARKSIKKGIGDGTYTKVQAGILVAETRKQEAEFVKNATIQSLITLGQNQGNEDSAVDVMLETGLGAGMDKADINFAIQQVKDDFTRLEAVRVEDEDDRVVTADADLSRRIYNASEGEAATTTAEVHKAKLPRNVRDSLLSSIRLRDKDIAEGKDIITSSFTQLKVNIVVSRVARGEISEAEGWKQLRNFEEVVNVKERNGNINAVTSAAESATDDTKRRNATVLDEREKKLRDSIERSQGVIQLVKDEEREFLRDIANIAVIELNDRFRNLDFTTQEIDDFNDDLMRKYVMSQKDISAALRRRGKKEPLNKKDDVSFLDSLLRGGR